MRLPAIVALSLACFLLSCYFQRALAIDVTFQDAPTSTNYDQESTLTASVSGSNIAGKNYYIRAAFFQEGKTNYFGYTKNQNSQWNNQPSEIDQYLKITIGPDNYWSGAVVIKPDSDSPYFKGKGDYLLKLGRYTESGTSVSWGNTIANIYINAPDPTPTPTPIPTPTPTPTPNPSPPPSPPSTPEVDSSGNLGTSSGSDGQNSSTSSTSSVLGITSLSVNRQDQPAPTTTPDEGSTNKSKTYPLFFIGSGAVFLAAAAPKLKELIAPLSQNRSSG